MSRRIALISEHASPLAALGGADAGGQNVYVGEVAKGLALRGYEVDVFTRRDGPLLPERADWVNGVTIVHVPAGPPEPIPKEDLLPWMDAFRSHVERMAARRRYELVHANFFMSGMVAEALKRRLGIPFVITFHALGRVRRQHQGERDRFPDRRFQIEDRLVRAADAIVAECPQDEEDLIRLYNADPARIAVIPCGFDPGRFFPISKPLARAALGLRPRERIVLQLGRMVPRKGVDTTIRGFARLVRDHGIAARLLVVGGDAEEPDPERTPELGRLMGIACEEGVADRVLFCGRRSRDELPKYYSAADVFVSTPWYEPFGITPVEAMASGTPVIGSNVGGIKFTVRDGETGYLVPPNDPGAVGDRLAHLYRYPKLRALLGRQAVRRARDLFTWDRVVGELEALYADVLARSSGLDPRRARGLRVVGGNVDAAAEALRETRRLAPVVVEAATRIAAAIRGGGKVLLCGNGGSAAEAQHFATELVGRFKVAGRSGLPAISLTADGSLLTAWANDASYEDVFARQVEALGRPGDVLVGLSTSGASPNVLRAFAQAGRLGLARVALTGGDGGPLARLADVAVVVPVGDTQRIQEVHAVLVHSICELVEEDVAAAAGPRVRRDRRRLTSASQGTSDPAVGG